MCACQGAVHASCRGDHLAGCGAVRILESRLVRALG